MKHLQTEIIIQAPIEKVWQILTDFSKYADWNPFIVSSEGEAKQGSRLVNKLKVNDKLNTFRPVLLEVTPNRRLEWLGKAPLGIFNGRHYYELEKISATETKFIHGEHFSGWLRGLIIGQIGEATRAGFIAMNQAVKARAEKG